MSTPVGKSAALCCLVSCPPPLHAPNCMCLPRPLLDVGHDTSCHHIPVKFLRRLHCMDFCCSEHAMALMQWDLSMSKVSKSGMTSQATPLVVLWLCSARCGCYASCRRTRSQRCSATSSPARQSAMQPWQCMSKRGAGSGSSATCSFQVLLSLQQHANPHITPCKWVRPPKMLRRKVARSLKPQYAISVGAAATSPNRHPLQCKQASRLGCCAEDAVPRILGGMHEGITQSLASSSYLDGRSDQGMPGPDQLSSEWTPLNVRLPPASLNAEHLQNLK